jgi:hypothetical protein
MAAVEAWMGPLRPVLTPGLLAGPENLLQPQKPSFGAAYVRKALF